LPRRLNRRQRKQEHVGKRLLEPNVMGGGAEDQGGRVRGKTRPGIPAIAILAIGSCVAGAALAHDGANYARIRHTQGVMTLERGEGGQAAEAALNRPIAPGDRLHSPVGRGEVQLADSSLIWVDHGSVLEFQSLADRDNRYERTNLVTLHRGRLRIETRDPADADAVFQVDSEAGSIYLLSAGSFRIEAEGGVTMLFSYSGVAEFSGDEGSVLVRSGQSSSVAVGGVPTAPRRFNTARRDPFDRYHDERLESYSDPGQVDGIPGDGLDALPQQVAPFVAELSHYGTWHSLPVYGTVWRPQYAGTWSPYAIGSWDWYAAGWIWVSHEPWGWAPFRYGRWDYAGTIGWFWIPGAVWGGAWVDFAVGPGHIGWCPLNYWNRPVFLNASTTLAGTLDPGRWDARGWSFMPIEQFGRQAVSPPGLRGERLARGRPFLITRVLPRFDPATYSKHADGGSDLVEVVRRARAALPSTPQDGEMISFRVEEARAARARKTDVPDARAAQPRPKSDLPGAPSRPARETGGQVAATPREVAPPAPAPAGTATGSDHAVGRLVDGARSGRGDSVPGARPASESATTDDKPPQVKQVKPGTAKRTAPKKPDTTEPKDASRPPS
jgi:uncharacterized protein DUF6600/FecR-like protein